MKLHHFLQPQTQLPRPAAVVWATGGLSCSDFSPSSTFVEQKDSPVIQLHFLGLPISHLVVFLTVSSRLVEPVELGILIRDPFLDGLPGWLDASERFDVEARGRRG